MAEKEDYLKKYAEMARPFTVVKLEEIPEVGNYSFRFMISLNPEFDGFSELYPIFIFDHDKRMKLGIIGKGHILVRIKGPRRGSAFQASINKGSVECSHFRMKTGHMPKTFPEVIQKTYEEIEIPDKTSIWEKWHWSDLPSFYILAYIDPKKRKWLKKK